VIRVPRLPTAIPINAETQGKTAWEGDTGTTHNLKDAAGRGIVPYTEAKVRWSDGNLYFLLYAGDLDLRGTVRKTDGPVENDDSFRLEFGSGDDVRVISVSVLGTIADAICSNREGGPSCDSRWSSHARVAVDRDGTLNQVGDNDEEWVVEMAVPFASLGIGRAGPGTRIPFSIRRCEMGVKGRGPCGSWGDATPRGELVLDP
jgi:hypothetical protein